MKKQKFIGKLFLSAAALMLAVITVFQFTSCSVKIQATELSAGYERRTDEEGSVSDAFCRHMADFSLELFRRTITGDEENDVVSPLSALCCLAMIANGSDGNTRTQIEQALGMEIGELNQCLYAYTNGLYTGGNCKVKLANSVWFTDDNSAFTVNKEFLQINADWYQAQVYAAPFGDKQTVSDINNWVKQYTDGMIDSILQQIPPDAVMYLINTLVFDARWKNKYLDTAISDGTFTNYNGTQSSVKMMTSCESVYLENENAIGFLKEYEGGQYSFAALLPNPDTDLYYFIDGLNGENWLSLWNSQERIAVDVQIPEFEYAWELNLKDVLADMGMTDMFSAASADFSKLGECAAGNLYCSAIRQKVKIEVNRNGTKAAAVTWGDMNAGSAAPIENKMVYLDRPFVYAIVDNSTGLPLFIGAVSYLNG